MSRICKMPIAVPAGVTVEENDGIVTVKGPKGELKQRLPKEITMKVDENGLTLEREKDEDREQFFRNYKGWQQGYSLENQQFQWSLYQSD